MNSRMVPVRDGSGEMFDGIATRYDALNRIMSLGIDRGWRARAVRALRLEPGARVLDIATGTGDLAIALARSVPGSTVVGLDPAPRMLDVARSKLLRAGLGGRVELIQGSAEQLPFADSSFDGVAIAFGIRNVPDRARALAEMARVGRRGSIVAILELSEPRDSWLSPLLRFHVHRVVPWVGGMLSGSREYRYLQRSIEAFPPARDFAAMMEAAGLDVLRVEPLTFGVAHLYLGRARGPA